MRLYRNLNIPYYLLIFYVYLLSMNVMNFFKFIASKKPEYNAEKVIDIITKGYSVPVNDESVADPETLKVDGLLTTNNSIPNFPDVRSYKLYSNGVISDYYYTFNMTDRRSVSYLADVYGCDDYNTIVRMMKYKSGIEEPSLKQKPDNPYEIDDITEITSFYGSHENVVLDFCKNYLNGRLDDEDKEEITRILEDADDEDYESFEYAMETNLHSFLEYLHMLNKDWCPHSIQVLHDYLFDCFRASAEYEADMDNLRFYIQCNDADESTDCNIEHVSYNWPFVSLHLSLNNTYGSEPEFSDDYNDGISTAQTIAQGGLSVKYVEEYFKKYPIDV